MEGPRPQDVMREVSGMVMGVKESGVEVRCPKRGVGAEMGAGMVVGGRGLVGLGRVCLLSLGWVYMATGGKRLIWRLNFGLGVASTSGAAGLGCALGGRVCGLASLGLAIGCGEGGFVWSGVKGPEDIGGCAFGVSFGSWLEETDGDDAMRISRTSDSAPRRLLDIWKISRERGWANWALSMPRPSEMAELSLLLAVHSCAS